MNHIIIKFGKNFVPIYGGPYFNKPADMFGVKLAAEIDEPFDLSLPIPDYSIPAVKAATKAIEETIDAISRGETIYAGCWGGKGRTGLFLALLAKVAGVENPVEYVRSTYNPHAVETKEQYDFVTTFPTFWLSWRYQLKSSKQLLTPQPPEVKSMPLNKSNKPR